LTPNDKISLPVNVHIKLGFVVDFSGKYIIDSTRRVSCTYVNCTW